MKSKVALFMVGLLCACFFGCSTPGRPYEDAKIAKIQKDVTTEAELVDWFGPASTRTMAPDGTKNLTWRLSTGNRPGSKSSGRLDVRLDREGKVTAYSASAGS